MTVFHPDSSRIIDTIKITGITLFFTGRIRQTISKAIKTNTGFVPGLIKTPKDKTKNPKSKPLIFFSGQDRIRIPAPHIPDSKPIFSLRTVPLQTYKLKYPKMLIREKAAGMIPKVRRIQNISQAAVNPIRTVMLNRVTCRLCPENP